MTEYYTKCLMGYGYACYICTIHFCICLGGNKMNELAIVVITPNDKLISYHQYHGENKLHFRLCPFYTKPTHGSPQLDIYWKRQSLGRHVAPL